MSSVPVKSYNTAYIFLPTHMWMWKELWRGNGGVKIEWFRAACPEEDSVALYLWPNRKCLSWLWSMGLEDGASSWNVKARRCIIILLQRRRWATYLVEDDIWLQCTLAVPLPRSLFSRAIEPFEERSIKSNKVFQQPANPLAATLQALSPFLKSVRRRLRASKTKSRVVWFASRSLETGCCSDRTIS